MKHTKHKSVSYNIDAVEYVGVEYVCSWNIQSNCKGSHSSSNITESRSPFTGIVDGIQKRREDALRSEKSNSREQ